MGKVICHDGTPFVDYRCQVCGFVMHVHKSQLPVFMDRVILLTFCKGCGTELMLPHPAEKDWVGAEAVKR